MSDLENKTVDTAPLNEEEEMKKIERLVNVMKYSLFSLVFSIPVSIALQFFFIVWTNILALVIGVGCFIVAAIRASKLKKLVITRAGDPNIKWNMISSDLHSAGFFGHSYSSTFDNMRRGIESPSFVQPIAPTLTHFPTMAENPVPNSGMQGYGPFGLYTGQTNPWP